MFAQRRINGATSGGQTNKISSHKEGLEAEASCFNLKKNKSWPIIFIAFSTKMADVLLIIVLRQIWSRGMFFGTQALPKNKGAYVDNRIRQGPV